MHSERDTPPYLERLATMTEICSVLAEHDQGVLRAKLLRYELMDSNMTINDARRIIGLPAIEEFAAQ